jgi:hypothetical protein
MSVATSSLLQYFVFVAAYPENPTSHWYVAGKDRGLSTADLDSSEYSWRRLCRNSVNST